jgi:glycosyltransferase involved in cell wall biosynthesis
MNPLVTVVTPSYNQGQFVRETIESVLSQDYSPLEYLVIDGGSTDGTLEVLKSYGERLFWISEKDDGQADAVNKGWRRARGEILGWLNSDDIYLPGAVSKAVAALQDNPSVAAVYGEGYHIDKAGNVLERYPTEPFSRSRLAETCYICQPTVFMRRSVLESVSLLDKQLKYCMDYDLWFRFARSHDMAHIPDYLACTRLYPETKTLGQRAKAHREILDVVCRECGAVPASWVYGYAHAVLVPTFDRTHRLGNSLFVLGLVAIAMKTFLQYNHRIPLSEFRRWYGWFRQHFQWTHLSGGRPDTRQR